MRHFVSILFCFLLITAAIGQVTVRESLTAAGLHQLEQLENDRLVAIWTLTPSSTKNSIVLDKRNSQFTAVYVDRQGGTRTFAGGYMKDYNKRTDKSYIAASLQAGKSYCQRGNHGTGYRPLGYDCATGEILTDSSQGRINVPPGLNQNSGFDAETAAVTAATAITNLNERVVVAENQARSLVIESDTLKKTVEDLRASNELLAQEVEKNAVRLDSLEGAVYSKRLRYPLRARAFVIGIWGSGGSIQVDEPGLQPGTDILDVSFIGIGIHAGANIQIGRSQLFVPVTVGAGILQLDPGFDLLAGEQFAGKAVTGSLGIGYEDHKGFHVAAGVNIGLHLWEYSIMSGNVRTVEQSGSVQGARPFLRIGFWEKRIGFSAQIDTSKSIGVHLNFGL